MTKSQSRAAALVFLSLVMCMALSKQALSSGVCFEDSRHIIHKFQVDCVYDAGNQVGYWDSSLNGPCPCGLDDTVQTYHQTVECDLPRSMFGDGILARGIQGRVTKGCCGMWTSDWDWPNGSYEASIDVEFTQATKLNFSGLVFSAVTIESNGKTESVPFTFRVSGISVDKDLLPGRYKISVRGSAVGDRGAGSWPIGYVQIQATTIPVSVPDRFNSIQAAIDSSEPGQILLVAEGTYNEAIDLKGKAITVAASGSRANTIIDGTGKTTSVVRAVTGETSATVLQGFTIRNGPIGSPVNTYRLGGGMFIDHASPTIRDCAFVNNAAGYGGGIYGLYSDSLVENCTFSQNAASTDGGGVQFFAGSPVVRGCTISDNLSTNRGGGLHLVQHTTGGFPTVDGCTITGNRTSVSEGGGVSIAPVNGLAQKPLVSNCTMQGNTAQGRGGGLYAPVSATAPQPNATLVNNTICGNTSLISKRENMWALFEDGGNTICDCFSDIDGNGSVNTGDIGFALLFVGDVTDPDYIQPDQDMNGFVDTADIALLLLNFGQCP